MLIGQCHLAAMEFQKATELLHKLTSMAGNIDAAKFAAAQSLCEKARTKARASFEILVDHRLEHGCKMALAFTF
jgi:HPt (histidine-containing phosphotransfer) domain-containing protein